MAVVSAQTRQTLTAVSGLIQGNLMNKASADLTKLIGDLGPQELVLASHDIRSLIEGFHKQRRRDLLGELDSRLANVTSPPKTDDGFTVRSPVSPAATEHLLSARASVMLQDLANNHIFKWALHYRDALRFIVDSALDELPESGLIDAELSAISDQFSAHSTEIFGRGYAFQIKRGLTPTVAELKSISGLQSFLDLAVSIYLERRQHVSSATKASILWGLTSSMLAGIAGGYGAADLGGVPGWHLIGKNPRSWVPPMGFCRGVDLMAFFEDFPSSFRSDDLFRALVGTSLAIDRLAHKFYGDDVLLPRLSRMSVQLPARLDITLTAKRGNRRQDLLVSCFWHGKLQSNQPITAAHALRAAVVVAALDDRTASWVERDAVQGVVNTEEHAAEPQQIHHLSELIFARLEAQEIRDDLYGAPSVMTHNFAGDFPLDDPDFRRQFLVQRHSVKLLLQEFDGTTGIHLWCSVRRSGKTTAAQELADSSGGSVVVTQTMDRVPRSALQNIFATRVREAFKAAAELSDDFFAGVVRECALAATAVDYGDSRVVFIIDEYESLFELIDAYSRSDRALKVMVALPLLSQMVDFATRNLLIFMGQRPDAYLILSAQNQLSPLVRQLSFPLFEHVKSALNTEFSQLLRYVLTEKLPFDESFAAAVYNETSGHPYLTVNLMVDFCDYLIGNRYRLGGAALSGQQFADFTRDRLAASALKRSPHYEFFHGQMAEYLSEQARGDEPWLSAIANLLRMLATKHPKNFTCAFSSYEQWAAPIGAAARMTAARLLTTGAQANFLRDNGGQVSAGVRLLARLAGAAAPKLN
ncbi:hypothetical protein [Verminephrobacter eiseniae]|uniref:hypothetical protein n=1 Tax=Verminephrobacter eiseniae TaxID=364317 RepID=UPI002238D2C1|nr:hypothetical protein [Verminephrobacter eiseniae]MCW5230913.1 hypothetical protein [Verminephrobacter eiseniae]MCW5292646.1 hypothetical protein [Verminephrobacter eiseniae]MCW8187204.1 hypothetical protein [Verminephrobacter eiseniae]MCW8225623.1 hypothetical protein [Verminephrobacter eiseniae]MCW8236511.1 hypothetical protein [Verminephrobacter eiseniae]